MQLKGSWRHREMEAEELSLPVRKQAWISLCWRMDGEGRRGVGGIFEQKELSQRQIHVRLEASRVGQDNTAQQIVVTPGAHTQPANMSAPDGRWGLNGSHESVTSATEFDKGQTKAVAIVCNITYNLNTTMLISPGILWVVFGCFCPPVLN